MIHDVSRYIRQCNCLVIDCEAHSAAALDLSGTASAGLSNKTSYSVIRFTSVQFQNTLALNQTFVLS